MLLNHTWLLRIILLAPRSLATTAAAAAAVGGAQLQGQTFLDCEAEVEDGSAHWALTKVFIMLLPASPLQYPLQPLSYRANTAYRTHSPGE